MVLRTFTSLRRPAIAVIAGGILAAAAIFGTAGISSAAPPPGKGHIQPTPTATAPALPPGTIQPESITWD